MTTIYHNPRCGKSRDTLKLLREKGLDLQVIEYLKTPPTEEQIRELIRLLGLTGPRELMRTKEREYKQLGLDNAVHSDDDLIRAMSAYPRLIERPIVVKDHQAVIGRPPENVLEIL